MLGFFPGLRRPEVHDKTGLPTAVGERGHFLTSMADRSWHTSGGKVRDKGRPVHSLLTVTEEADAQVLVPFARTEPVDDVFLHCVGTRQGNKARADPGSRVGFKRPILPGTTLHIGWAMNHFLCGLVGKLWYIVGFALLRQAAHTRHWM